MFGKRKKKSVKMDFKIAPDVRKVVEVLVKRLSLEHVDLGSVYFVRSQGSKTRAYARIWGLSRIFQIAAGFKPTYVIEVISKYYDKLPQEEKVKVLIHELMHIPKTFSGALKSHRGPHHRINSREVEKIFKLLEKKS